MRLGKMQGMLESLLKRHGKVTQRTLARPSWSDIENAGFDAMATNVYRALGGTLDIPPSRLGSWDIEFDGIALELDEHLHFNRYRASTLASPIYDRLQGFPRQTYIEYCSLYEEQCLRVGSYGGKWANPSCEKQFGIASESGNLNGGGAPRWKQRAFYDFLKDLSPLVLGIRTARISIWDRLPDPMAGLRVLDALSRPSDEAESAIIDLVRSRICSARLE